MTVVTNIISSTSNTSNTATSQTAVQKKELLMPKDAKELLKQLYLLRAYSGFEDPIRNFITAFLDQLHIPYVNYNGNILGFNHPGAPLFSAHMDMVNTEGYKLQAGENRVSGDYVFTIDSETCIRLYRDKDKKVQTSLGADDKNGIWVILNLLKRKKKINFAFCHSEEVGGTGSLQIVQDAECAKFIEQCKYGIIIDRRNAHDIIGYQNEYCVALDDRLEKFAEENGYQYKTTSGSISDADRFSTLLECVNISCAYYDPHSSRENTNLNELWNTLQFCIDIVDKFNYESVSAKRMQAFKKCKCPYNTYTTYYTYNTTTSNTTSSEKKNAEKTKSTSIASEKNTSTTTDTKSLLTRRELLEYLDDALKYGATFSTELEGFIIPLFDENSLPPTTDPKDIVCSIPCTCESSEKVGILLQNSLDALFMEYYNAERGEKIFGLCTKCRRIQDITSYVRYLL